MRRISVIALALVLTVGALMLGASPERSRAAGPGLFGVVFQGPLEGPDVTLLSDLRPASARLFISWATVQQSVGSCLPTNQAGNCHWEATDSYVGAAAAAGATTLPFFYGGVPWDTASAENVPPIQNAASISAWQSFLRAAVQRYGQGGTYWAGAFQDQFPGYQSRPIHYWQVWNEPGSSTFFAPSPNPGRYARLLVLSARTIRSTDRSAKVVLAGLFSGGNHSVPGRVSAVPYLSKLYQIKGIRSAFDVVALHPYATNPADVIGLVRQVRGVMKRNGDGKKSMWITELGWASNVNPGSLVSKGLWGQARSLTQAFSALAARRSAFHLIGVDWYAFDDLPPHDLNNFPWAGLVDTAGTPKPSYFAFRKFTH